MMHADLKPFQRNMDPYRKRNRNRDEVSPWRIAPWIFSVCFSLVSVCFFLVSACLMIGPAAAAEAQTEGIAFGESSQVFPDPEVWNADHMIACPEGRSGCMLLQTVMMGSFREFDPGDALTRRICSAIYPQLSAVTQDDLEHFCAEFNEDRQLVRELLYESLSNCLWAYILTEKAPDEKTAAAWHVLLLFLDPSSEPDAETQMESIRNMLTEQTIGQITEAAGADLEFIRSLLIEESRECGF